MPLGLRAPPPATFRGEREPLKRTLGWEGPARPTANRALNGNDFCAQCLLKRARSCPNSLQSSPFARLLSGTRLRKLGRLSQCPSPGREPGPMEGGFHLLSSPCLRAPKQEGVPWMGSLLWVTSMLAASSLESSFQLLGKACLGSLLQAS